VSKTTDWIKNAGVQWARGWTSKTHEALFEVLCSMQTSHEKTWAAGNGRLDGIRHWKDLSWDQTETLCDQGVILPARDVLKRDLFIIGDIHGDVDSLDRAIEISGVAENKSTVLFLGDFGDRGTGTLGVWATVAALKSAYPERVFLLRGNHEEMIAVRTSRIDNGEMMRAPWFIPGNGGDAESYFALGQVLPGQDPSTGSPSNLVNVEELFRFLPSAAFLPDDGTLIVHGGIPPRWTDRDGSKFTSEQKQALTVVGLEDFRKPQVQRATRWTRPLEKDDVDEAWRNPREPVCSLADFRALQEATGCQRMIHGHNHPADGFERGWGGLRMVVNSNKITGEMPAVLKREPNGNFTPIPLR